MLILSNEEIETLLDMPTCLSALEALYREIGEGRAVDGPRADVIVPAGEGRSYALKTMSGVVPGARVGAIRLNSDILSWPTVKGVLRREKIPAAPGRTWVGLVLLFSAETGEILAIFPDGVVQRMRVGATNGLGARSLAREDARTVGLLGSGWQAGGQLMAFCAVRPISTIRVFSPNPENRRRFAREMTERLRVEVRPVDSPEDAMAGADIVASATNALSPTLAPEWARPGVHLSAVKAQEMNEELFARCDRVILHTRRIPKQTNYISAESEAKIPEIEKGWWTNRVTPFWTQVRDLADLTTGAAPGRVRREEITCFMNNVGLGTQFAAVGAVVYQRAREKGVGRELPTEWFLQDVHP